MKIADWWAAAIIAEHHIVDVEEDNPANVVFRLGDGRRLKLWDASYDYDREWELVEEAEAA